MADLVHITAAEAAEALTAAASEDGDGQKIVHCFAGPFGADWSLQGALDLLPTARDIAWVDHWCGHDLAVLTDEGRTRFFDAKRPAAADERRVSARDLRPGDIVSHPDWLDGDPVRIVTARVGAGVVAIRYRDVRAHHPDTQVEVPPDFQVTPGAGFESHTTPTPSRES